MGRLRLVLFLAVLTLMPLRCAAGPADDASVVVDRWVTAFNSNDVDALVSLYAPNAVLVGSTGLVLKEGARPSAAISPGWPKVGTRSLSATARSSCSKTTSPMRLGSMNSARFETAR